MAKLPHVNAQPLTIAEAASLMPMGTTPLPSALARPLQRGGSVTNDAGYWRSPGVIIPRQLTGSGMPSLGAPLKLMKDTPPGRYYPELGIATQLPPWQDPTYWSEPLEQTFTCPGVPWYATWTTVQTFTVESGWQYVIRGLCFEWANIPIGDVFEFSIWSGGQVLSTVQSMRISAAANPAFQYAIGGPQRPILIYGVADQNQDVQVRVRVLGPQATNGTFSKVDSDPLGLAVTTLLIGWRAPLIDTSDGGPTAGDVFPISDGIDAQPRYDLDELRPDRGGPGRAV
jgi:hypothetical protein